MNFDVFLYFVFFAEPNMQGDVLCTHKARARSGEAPHGERGEIKRTGG